MNERVREAQKAVMLYATSGCKAGPECIGCMEAALRVDALIAAVRESMTRTETYAHDCGCETCGDHTLPAVLSKRAEVTEAMVIAAVCAFWVGNDTEQADVAMHRALTAALEAQ